MTLTTLLRHVGVQVPRGVTVDGRIVLGAAAATAVTPLAPHTFHGDMDSKSAPAWHSYDEPRAQSDDAWWNLRSDRLEEDQAAVRTSFPSFQASRENGEYTWHGVLNTGRGRFRVAVIGNPADGIPFIQPLQPRRLGRQEGRRWRSSPHLYINGGLCIAETKDWIPGQHTTATAIAWAAHWLAAYTDWRLGGPWPTDGYQPHAA